MFKLLKRALLLLLVAIVLYSFVVVRDRKTLNDQIIRLHVVGASDSDEDQRIKEKVRDAVLEKLEIITSKVSSKEEAQALLSEGLEVLRNTANEVLTKAGVSDQATVTLEKEAFDTRVYDTFTLPAGVYDSLRIIIGDGEGKNWWCVVFPTLCIPAAASGVEDVAASAGFSEGLGESLTQKEKYPVRFFLLDAIGRLQNYFFEH